jgi:hypothetical protein
MSNRNGYPSVVLKNKDKIDTQYIHKLVCAAFIGPCPQGYQVNHKDFDRTNNHISNLEYVTPSENVRHAIDAGRIPRGSEHPYAKLSEEDVLAIRKMWNSEQYSNKEIGELFNISQAHISNIAKGEKWRHIPGAIERDKNLPKKMPKRRCLNARLTTEEVIEIKKLLKEGTMTKTEIGKRFNTTIQNISLIAKGINWKWLSV